MSTMWQSCLNSKFCIITFTSFALKVAIWILQLHTKTDSALCPSFHPGDQRIWSCSGPQCLKSETHNFKMTCAWCMHVSKSFHVIYVIWLLIIFIHAFQMNKSRQKSEKSQKVDGQKENEAAGRGGRRIRCPWLFLPPPPPPRHHPTISTPLFLLKCFKSWSLLNSSLHFPNLA